MCCPRLHTLGFQLVTVSKQSLENAAVVDVTTATMVAISVEVESAKDANRGEKIAGGEVATRF